MVFGDNLKRILYVLHSGMSGGTFHTTRDLMKNLNDTYDIFVLGAENDSLRLYNFSNGKLELIKKYSRDFKLRKSSENTSTIINKWSAKDFHNSWATHIYFEILTKYDINIIHIMHLINHSFDLPQVADKLDIPVVLSIHDYYFLCPFYTLVDENNNYCKAKCDHNNENCYMPWDILDDINSKEIIPKWRENVKIMFSYVDYFIAPSEIIKKLFFSVYDNQKIINDTNFKIIEHGRDFPKITKTCYEIPSKEKPIKILCLANNLDSLKGANVIKNIKKQDSDNLIEFHFLGNCKENLSQYGSSHGRYERNEFYDKIYEIKPSFIGIFSISPESFCHTLTEAWSCHIPVIGSNIGVIKDRIIKNNGGWIVDINNPKTTYNSIINISKDLNEYQNIIKNLKAMKFKSTTEMVKEYVDIYKLVE